MEEAELLFHSFLQEAGCLVGVADPLSHATRLARIARNFNSREGPHTWSGEMYTPMAALLQSFASAKKCIHFVSFGLSYFMLRVITVTAQRIPVNGVVVAPSAAIAKLLLDSKESNDEVGGRLDLRPYSSEGGNADTPHQKIVVIDGMLAFKGSANLTDYAWRKARNKNEIIEVVTDYNEVIDLNNKYFSPAWRKAYKPHPKFPESISVNLEFSQTPKQAFDLPMDR
jgi:phosphatidylserine/phosphatidylglycerophosphate/cardiolipin synthase-like enzyme